MRAVVLAAARFFISEEHNPCADYTEVSILNILGAPVAHLFSGELGVGNHSFAWDARGAAPGSYWCILRMNGRVERVGLLRE